MDTLERWVENCAPVVRGGVRVAIALVCVGAVVALASMCTGCGSPRSQHRTLNAITAVADPTYAAAVAGCDAARDVIVERTGTTLEEDTAAMDEIDRVCDGIVTGFETLRGTQQTARAAIDEGAESAVAGAIALALDLWRELQAMVPELEALGREGSE